MRLLPLLALLWLPTHARAAQVLGVQVMRDGAHFLLRMQVAIDAPPPAVFRALTDYAALPRSSPDVRAVRVEATADPNRVRMFTTIHSCFLFFCKTLHQEQIMTATANASGGVVEATLVPQRSEFKQGYGRWTVHPCPTGTLPACMEIQIEVVPAFWVPPVIGPWIIRRKLYAEAQRTSMGLERVAGGLASR